MPDIPADAWSSPWLPASVAAEQGRLARIALDDWLAGKPHAAFDALRKLIDKMPNNSPRDGIIRFIEVGSGTGYGSAVLNAMRPQWHYHGIEISPAMIEYAREHWPAYYQQGDAQCLDDSFVGYECVMLAAVIQHCPDWRKAVSEAVRVSSRWVILHRTMCTSLPTREYTIEGYGQTLPIREHNAEELMDYCFSLELNLVDKVLWDIEPSRWQGSFLLEKAP